MKSKQLQKQKPIVIVWIFMLIVSILPEVIIKELFMTEVANLQEIRLVFMMGIALGSLIIKQLSELRNYIIVLAMITGLNYFGDIIQGFEIFGSFFGGEDKAFIQGLASYQLIRLFKAIIMFFVLMGLFKERRKFFFVKGNLDAIAKPIKGLVKNPTPWRKFAIQFGVYITLGLLVFLVIAGGIPSGESFIKIVPILPFIVIFAGINSLYEELNLRAAIIATLKNHVGSGQALWISAVYFGIIHFYGVPYGVLGVLLATFLGYIIGNSMIESGGFVYAFLLHIIQDIIIFAFLAIGAVKAGGL